MFSTICLLFLCGFMLWMNTSARIAWPEKHRLLASMAARPLYNRYVAGLLFAVATALCIVRMGWGSGLFAAIVILMTAGSVAVLFFPFRYFGSRSIATIYVFALAFELLI